MHASSLENMQRCYEEVLARSSLILKRTIRVLDIGGRNINGSYRDIFSHDKFHYSAADIENATDVDIVFDNPYSLPFHNGEFDIIICGQVLEHVEFFWKLFCEMARILNPDGFIFLIVPSSGPIHRYPSDCYRFLPDSMKALANYAKINLYDSWIDNRGPWNDLVGIFSHRKITLFKSISIELPLNRYMENTGIAPLIDIDTGPEFESTKGSMNYLEFLKNVHDYVEPCLYLEIGVRKGKSFLISKCKAIGIDPQAEMPENLPDNYSIFKTTSDLFFRNIANTIINNNKPDLIFIDGMHLFEFALRDFINAEKYAKAETVIVIDDIYFNHPIQAERKRKSRVWTGDIWKLYFCLLEYRPDLCIIGIDTSPTGMMIVCGLDPNSTTLMQEYNPIVRKSSNIYNDIDQTKIINRDGALSPKDPKIKMVLQEIKKERKVNKPDLSGRLKKICLDKYHV